MVKDHLCIWLLETILNNKKSQVYSLISENVINLRFISETNLDFEENNLIWIWNQKMSLEIEKKSDLIDSYFVFQTIRR